MDIQRPKNITDSQWKQAKSLYNTAKSKGDRYPELTVAQAALETGWFKHPSGKFNYFGQKASKSQKGTVLKTTEASNNKYYKTQSKFRDYDSIDEAVDDRLKKWGSKYKDAKNVDEAIGKIWQYDEKTGQGKGYATDIKYGSKIKSILNTLGFNTATETPNPPQTQTSEYKDFADVQTLPETQGIVFTEQQEEIPEVKESIKASQRLNEKSFLEELQQKYILPEVVQQPQFEQPYIPTITVSHIQYNPIQEFQDGGTLRDETYRKFPVLDKIDDFANPKNFTKEYINSPLYLQRLKNSGYENPEQEQKERLKNVEGVKVLRRFGKPITNGSVYYRNENHIFNEPEADEKNIKKAYIGNATPQEVVTHEMGHSEMNPNNNTKHSRLNEKDFYNLIYRQKAVKSIKDEEGFQDQLKQMYQEPDLLEHDLNPNEVKSDLNSIRYMLKDRHLKDTTKEEIKSEDLKRLKNSAIKNRLLDNYEEEDLLWILNNIADNAKTENTFYAQDGGEIPISSNGVYDYPKQQVIVPTTGKITMKNVDYPILGVSMETGEEILMYPGKEYFFKNTKRVLETPQI